jgi:hypothetical protein
LDVLQQTGQFYSLLRSGVRFSERVKVLDALVAGEAEPVSITKIGLDLFFRRLWKKA